MGQLTEYILKYKQTYSKEQISQALLKKGCTTEQFEKAWSEAEKTPTQEVTAPAEIQSEQNQEVTASRQVQKTPTQEGGRRASKLIIISLIIIIAIGSVYFGSMLIDDDKLNSLISNAQSSSYNYNLKSTVTYNYGIQTAAQYTGTDPQLTTVEQANINTEKKDAVINTKINGKDDFIVISEGMGFLYDGRTDIRWVEYPLSSTGEVDLYNKLLLNIVSRKPTNINKTTIFFNNSDNNQTPWYIDYDTYLETIGKWSETKSSFKTNHNVVSTETYHLNSQGQIESAEIAYSYLLVGSTQNDYIDGSVTIKFIHEPNLQITDAFPFATFEKPETSLDNLAEIKKLCPSQFCIESAIKQADNFAEQSNKSVGIYYVEKIYPVMNGDLFITRKNVDKMPNSVVTFITIGNKTYGNPETTNYADTNKLLAQFSETYINISSSPLINTETNLFDCNYPQNNYFSHKAAVGHAYVNQTDTIFSITNTTFAGRCWIPTSIPVN